MTTLYAVFSSMECPECGDVNPEQSVGAYCSYECFTMHTPAWMAWYELSRDSSGEWRTDEDSLEAFEALVLKSHGVTFEQLRATETIRHLRELREKMSMEVDELERIEHSLEQIAGNPGDRTSPLATQADKIGRLVATLRHLLSTGMLVQGPS